MKRRDTERKHELANKIYEKSHMYDLQGLLIGKNGAFTAAIEAFEIQENEEFDFRSAFTIDSLRAKCTLASKINVPFYIIVHKENTECFVFHRVALHNNQVVEASQSIKSTAEFIQWWAENKGTIQTKRYNEMQGRISDSYIDDVLETNNLKWGGNIDGFIISKHDSNRLLAIIEKRVTASFNIADYDPANYYNYRGGDYNTWLPVYNLARMLHIPLFLITFQEGNNISAGAAVIKEVLPKQLVYESLPPNKNLFDSIIPLKRWISKYLKLHTP